MLRKFILNFAMNIQHNHLLAARLDGQRVWLTCPRGAAEDLTIYSRRESESEYEPLDAASDSLLDDRPKLNPALPERRFYYAILLYSGSENRMKSNEVVLTVP